MNKDTGIPIGLLVSPEYEKEAKLIMTNLIGNLTEWEKGEDKHLIYQIGEHKTSRLTLVIDKKGCTNAGALTATKIEILKGETSNQKNYRRFIRRVRHEAQKEFQDMVLEALPKEHVNLETYPRGNKLLSMGFNDCLAQVKENINRL